MSTTVIENPVHVTDATFDETVGASGKVVFVDFWADRARSEEFSGQASRTITP